MADDEKGGPPPKDKAGKQPPADKDKQGNKDKQPAKRKPLWPWLLGGAVVLGFVAVVLVTIFAPAPDVWTDDAYVTAHYATIAPVSACMGFLVSSRFQAASLITSFALCTAWGCSPSALPSPAWSSLSLCNALQ